MVALALNSAGTISDCDALTGWTGDTFILEPDVKVQGSNAVSWAATANGANDAYMSGSFNLAGSHLRLSINLTYQAYWAASNVIQIYLHDGSNTEYITVFNTISDYPGGWQDVVIDSALFSTITLSSVTRVGLRVNCASKPRNTVNSFVDNWRYSNGLVLTSTTTEAFNFTDAAGIDATNVYNILSLLDGILFTKGEILLGGTGAENCNLVSVQEQIVFPDRLVDSALYKIKTQQGSGTTDINIDGLVCKTVGNSAAEIDISSNLNSLSIINSTFISMGTITLTATVVSPTFDSNSFTFCGATEIGIPISNCIFNNCAVLNVANVLTSCTVTNANIAAGEAAITATDLVEVGTTDFTRGSAGHAVELTFTP